LRDCLPAGMQPAALAERDELLHHRPQILRLRQRGDDLLVLDQRCGKVRQHGTAVIRTPVEFAMGFGVTHFRLLRRQVSDIRCQKSGIRVQPSVIRIRSDY
jgi:hypothetical protein